MWLYTFQSIRTLMEQKAQKAVDNMFITWMTKLSDQRIDGISLLDVPALFSVADPNDFLTGDSIWSNQPRSSYSIDGPCDAWTFVETYARDWSCQLNGCPEYIDNAKNVTVSPCFYYIHNLFQDKLELVMKLMKYSIPGTGPRFSVFT